MKRIRLLTVTALAAASLGITAAPASACEPEFPCCHESIPNQLWRKLTGGDLYVCW